MHVKINVPRLSKADHDMQISSSKSLLQQYVAIWNKLPTESFSQADTASSESRSSPSMHLSSETKGKNFFFQFLSSHYYLRNYDDSKTITAYWYCLNQCESRSYLPIITIGADRFKSWTLKWSVIGINDFQEVREANWRISKEAFFKGLFWWVAC